MVKCLNIGELVSETVTQQSMIKYGKVFKHRRAGQGDFIQQSMITYGKVGRRRAGQGDRLVGSQTKKHCR